MRGLRHDDAGGIVPTDGPGTLLVGSLAAAESSEFCSKHGVTHILTVAGASLGTKPGILVHSVIEIADHPAANLLEVLPQCLAFVESGLRDGGAVLVHCASGVSRSVSVCVAHLMSHGLSLEDALRTVRTGRSQGQPNLGFTQQLQLLEREGSVEAAARHWSASTAEEAIASAQQQRAAANALHASADGLEERVAALRSSPPEGDAAAAAASELAAALGALQLELDACIPAEGDGLALRDRPALSIRKAASSKVARLLADLDPVGS